LLPCSRTLSDFRQARSQPEIVLTESTISAIANVIETIGTTNLCLDAKGQAGPNVVTVGGPAKKTFAKVGS
jgi:hypothetical protein